MKQVTQREYAPFAVWAREVMCCVVYANGPGSQFLLTNDSDRYMVGRSDHGREFWVDEEFYSIYEWSVKDESGTENRGVDSSGARTDEHLERARQRAESYRGRTEGS